MNTKLMQTYLTFGGAYGVIRSAVKSHNVAINDGYELCPASKEIIECKRPATVVERVAVCAVGGAVGMIYSPIMIMSDLHTLELCMRGYKSRHAKRSEKHGYTSILDTIYDV
jgi:hypothetical protein